MCKTKVVSLQRNAEALSRGREPGGLPLLKTQQATDYTNQLLQLATHLQLPLCHDAYGSRRQRQEDAEKAYVGHIALHKQVELIEQASTLDKDCLQQQAPEVAWSAYKLLTLTSLRCIVSVHHCTHLAAALVYVPIHKIAKVHGNLHQVGLPKAQHPTIQRHNLPAPHL